MEIISANENHLDQINIITSQAKKQLYNLRIDQWQSGYPSEEIWKDDIKYNRSYVAFDKESVLGVFMFQTTPDSSYFEIEGQWLTKGSYASMHRVCVADESKGKGVAGEMFAYGFNKAKKLGFSSLRIDTHPDNLPMQKALKKAGFQFCGKIHLADGPEKGNIRIGFEKIL